MVLDYQGIRFTSKKYIALKLLSVGLVPYFEVAILFLDELCIC